MSVSDSPLVVQRLVRGDIIPRWWGMEWDFERIALRIYVHRFFLEHDRHVSIPPYGDAIVSLLESLGFGLRDFSGDLRDLSGFGINRAFIPIDAEGPQFAEFLVPYPQIDRVAGACDRCADYDGTEHCIACQGTGERREIDWKAAHAISVSLHLFFHMVQFPDALPIGDDPQFMEIEVSAGKGRAGISGEFGLPLRAWLSSRLPNSRIDQMERAMMQAHRRLFGIAESGDSPVDALQLRAGIDFRDGWLNMSCPGFSGGCGVSPVQGSFHSPGYQFMSHSMDTPMQTLTMLAGLAALHDMVDSVWRVTMPVARRNAS